MPVTYVIATDLERAKELSDMGCFFNSKREIMEAFNIDRLDTQGLRVFNRYAGCLGAVVISERKRKL